MSERFASFREFYPFYLGEHRNRTCRRLHFAGTSFAIGFIVLAAKRGNPWWLLAALAVGLRIRVGRPLLLREEPSGHLQASVLFLRRRLGDVPGHPDRADSVLAERSHSAGVGVAGARPGTTAARMPPMICPTRGGPGKTPLRGNLHVRSSGGHSRKISHAATTISAKPAQWFHFSGCPRYQVEKPTNTSRVMTSCMPFSCGAL